MLVLPILIPAFLDRLIEPTLTFFEANFGLPDLLDDEPVWMRVKPVEPSPGVLVGVEFAPTPEQEADLDLEFDVDLTIEGDRLVHERNCVQFHYVFLLHWLGVQLRRRMDAEGRELAHLSDSALEALKVSLWSRVCAPAPWLISPDEVTTYLAALYEQDAREDESHHERLLAIRDAAPLRERAARERADALAWFARLGPMRRIEAFDDITAMLDLPDLIVAGYRHAKARGDAGLDHHTLSPVDDGRGSMIGPGRP